MNNKFLIIAIAFNTTGVLMNDSGTDFMCLVE